MTRTEKVIVFKKQRRKRYQKSNGHKQEINVIKIDRIEHIITEETLADGNVRELAMPNNQSHIKMF